MSVLENAGKVIKFENLTTITEMLAKMFPIHDNYDTVVPGDFLFEAVALNESFLDAILFHFLYHPREQIVFY